MSMRAAIAVLALMLTIAADARAQVSEISVTVTNPSSFVRRQEPVTVPWSMVAQGLPGVVGRSVTVTGDDSRLYLVQVDDLDADGTPDELVFVADFAAKQTRTFVIKAGPAPVTPAPPVRTDAGNWKKTANGAVPVDDDDGPGLLRAQSSYRFDGIGWESELTGYRLYLDERNALDIQGKRLPGLYWNFMGSSGVDYQADANWGMDVLHVGPALGSGGFAFWSGDSVVKPFDVQRRRTRILARGPVRVVIRVEYTGWKVGAERVDATSIYTMYGGESFTEHTLTVRGSSTRMMAAGLVKHAAAKVTWNVDAGVLSSEGKQSRSGEWLRMAIHVRPEDVQKVTKDQWNDLILMKSKPGGTIRYAVSNRWAGEKNAATKDSQADIWIGARLTAPLVPEAAK